MTVWCWRDITGAQTEKEEISMTNLGCENIDYLLGRNAKLERMLERLEYIETALDDDYDDFFFVKACPICGGIYPPDYHRKIDTERLRKIYTKGHEDNCELAKLIREGKQWNVT